MAENEGQEKTYEPSERKKREAAEKGQIVRSQEINSFFVLLAGVSGLVFFYQPMVKAIRQVFLICLDVNSTPLNDIPSTLQWGGLIASFIGMSIVIPMVLIVVLVLISGFAQSRFQLATKVLTEPKWERLNPIEGIKNKFFSWDPLIEAGKGIFKLIALSGITYWAISSEVNQLASLADMPPIQLIMHYRELGWKIVSSALPLLVVIAIVDYAYNWWRLNDQLKMTHEEFKREMKEVHGDPYLRSARRQRARQIALGQTISKVQDADVVLTNPTHFSVALRYRHEEAPAPMILAMGADHLAMRIRQEAKRHEIPCVENRPLARGLYRKGKIGQAIPEEFFPAVAQVLAVIYRRRMHRPPPPKVQLDD